MRSRAGHSPRTFRLHARTDVVPMAWKTYAQVETEFGEPDGEEESLSGRKMMKASYLGAMGYAQRSNFPTTWPIPPSYHDPETSVRSYQEGMEECELAEEMGFAWVSFSEHHYSGRIATGTPHLCTHAV